MLVIEVKSPELFDEEKNEFLPAVSATLRMEHSLISLSKWEARYKKPFLNREDKTVEETVAYFKDMTINKVEDEVYDRLTPEEIERIQRYISDPMTATTFNGNHPVGPSQIVTSELIYFWMTQFGIPFEECQKWHINRLLTLIRVCSIKTTPQKKRNPMDVAQEYRNINAMRRRATGSKG